VNEHVRLAGGAEFDLIRRLADRYGDAAAGLGDDAGVVPVPPGEQLVASTDVAVEDVHFRSHWLAPAEIGYRAAMAALSDLAAMGAAPRAMLVALTLPERWRTAVDEVADGIALAARETGAPIVGGDVTSGTALALAITVLGSAVAPMRRTGASVGDAVWVTGALGGPGLALAAYAEGRAPDLEHARRFAAPRARIGEGQWLATHGATAAVDISDGLGADLAHLAAASGVRVTVDLDRLPLVAGATPEQAVASGEEYELAVTGPASLDADAFAREFGIPLTRIGTVESGDAGVAGTRLGKPAPIPAGFGHFAR
jgi:thiamine-monophosphate kinase